MLLFRDISPISLNNRTWFGCRRSNLVLSITDCFKPDRWAIRLRRIQRDSQKCMWKDAGNDAVTCLHNDFQREFSWGEHCYDAHICITPCQSQMLLWIALSYRMQLFVLAWMNTKCLCFNTNIHLQGFFHFLWSLCCDSSTGSVRMHSASISKHNGINSVSSGLS